MLQLMPLHIITIIIIIDLNHHHQVREIGSMLQLMPLLIVPFVGVIQTCRYFLHGPDDLFDVSS